MPRPSARCTRFQSIKATEVNNLAAVNRFDGTILTRSTLRLQPPNDHTMTAASVLTADVGAMALLWPIATVAVSTRQSAALATLGAIVWLAASGALLAAMGLELPAVFGAHIVLASAALATAGVGRVLRGMFVDSLDAIAMALSVCCGASFGIFVTGRFAGELPASVLSAVLAVNPLVATTTAASIDIFHTPLLYRASPIAHQLFDYPAWQVSSALFLGVASVCVALTRWATRRLSPHQA